jgi:hypothetical protein
MPNFLRLTDKTTGQSHEGRGLIEVDEKLCAALGVPVDEVSFYLGWVDWMPLYVCDTWDKVREAYEPYKDKLSPEAWERKTAIIDWLAEHYDLNSYAMIGRC